MIKLTSVKIRVICEH